MVDSPALSREAEGSEAAAASLRVERALAGDLEAFGDLAAEAWPELVRLARVALAGSPDAEDVAQQALLVAWRKRDRVRATAGFRPWLRRIVWREALRTARRWGRSQRLDSGSVEEPCRDDPSARLEVRRLLATLSPRQRAVVHLGEIEGLSTGEIARELGLAATVRVHRWQALRRMRRLMEQSNAPRSNS